MSGELEVILFYTLYLTFLRDKRGTIQRSVFVRYSGINSPGKFYDRELVAKELKPHSERQFVKEWIAVPAELRTPAKLHCSKVLVGLKEFMKMKGKCVWKVGNSLHGGRYPAALRAEPPAPAL